LRLTATTFYWKQHAEIEDEERFGTPKKFEGEELDITS